MKLVVIESPYRGATPAEQEANIAYARACLRDCIERGESPIASHLLLTQPGVLDDAKADERLAGILAGHAWLRVADICAVYLDRGISEGMRQGMNAAAQAGVRIVHRRISPWSADNGRSDFDGGGAGDDTGPGAEEGRTEGDGEDTVSR